MSATTLTAKAAKKTTAKTLKPEHLTVVTDRLEGEMLDGLIRDLGVKPNDTKVPLAGPGDVALRSLRARMQRLAAEFETAETDEHTERLSAEMSEVEVAILTLPCSGAEVAQAKLRGVLKCFEAGEIGGEDAAIKQVIAWLGVEYPAPLPATPPNTADDTRLIELDAELELLLAAANAKHSEMAVLSETARQQAHAERDAGSLGQAGVYKRIAEIEGELGMETIEEALTPLENRLGGMARVMLGLRATTVAGLRAKARLAAYWHRFDPDCREISSTLVRDVALFCGLPGQAVHDTARSLFGEYEVLGGKITALRSPIGGRAWIGIKPAPPSTRATEIERQISGETIKQLYAIALDAHGQQPWASDDEVIKVNTRGAQ